MTFTTFCRLLSQAVIHSRQPVALNWARKCFGLVLTVFLRKTYILDIAEYFLIVLFQISDIKKDEIRFRNYILLLDMFLIVGGRVPATGMLAGMNLSKPGINLSKPGMSLSKPGKKHRNHVIITHTMTHVYSLWVSPWLLQIMSCRLFGLKSLYKSTKAWFLFIRTLVTNVKFEMMVLIPRISLE